MLKPGIRKHRKQYKICIIPNRIHIYQKAHGAAQEDENKQRRRKWLNTREHILSAEHIDWHEWDGTRQ